MDRAPRLLIVLTLAVAAGCASMTETKTVDPGVPDVSPALEQDQAHRLKRRVAIARFSNETLYGKSVLLLREADFVTRQAADMLSARLGESGQFVLIEYTDREALLRALDDRAVKELGIPADYVIIGSLMEFGRETEGETGVFSRTKTQRAHAKVNVRIVDVNNSRVIFATEGTGEAESQTGQTFGVGTTQGYDSSLNDKAISAAVSAVTNNLAETLLEQPWRSYVLSVEADAVLIAGGASQGIRKGDKFAVMEKGKMVDNPQSGEKLELPRTRVAVIEVDSTFGNELSGEGSRCRIVSGTVDGADVGRYVVQEVE
jgi:curli biogenesis system outer membrane secretion channel CsgG